MIYKVNLVWKILKIHLIMMFKLSENQIQFRNLFKKVYKILINYNLTVY